MPITLAKAIERVERLFPLTKFKVQTVSIKYTAKIYSNNSIFYTLFHSFDGSLHMALTDRSNSKKRAHHHQLDKIASALEEQQNPLPRQIKVLELGCGKGYNLLFLAKKFPDISFTGIDITPAYVRKAKKRVKALPNVEILQMDMDKIDFDAESFRIIYDIESICHSHEHEKLLEKCHHMLEKKGQFLLFELFRRFNTQQKSLQEKQLLQYVELAVAIYQGIHLQDWLALAKTIGFRVVEGNDLSQRTIYGLTRFHKMAAPYFKFPLLAKSVNLFIPKELQAYAIAAYLFKYSMERGLQVYSEITLEK